MKPMKSLAALTMLGLVLGAVPAAYARPGDCGPGDGPRHGRGFHFERMADELQLTDDQKAQLQAWREERRAQNGDRREAMRAVRQQMHALMTADTVDEAAIRAKVGELGDARADRAVEHAYFMQRVRSILTPEQREKLQALRPGFRGRMKNGDRGFGSGYGLNQ